MEIKLLEFGKNGYPITNKTLPFLDKLVEKEHLIIGSVRPVKNSFMGEIEFRREYREFKPSNVAGKVVDIEYDFSPEGLVLFGRLVPEGPKKGILEAAIRVYQDKLDLLPRAITEYFDGRFELVELIGFDLFLDEQGVHNLMVKHSENVEGYSLSLA
jgi:hypothetical protein